MDEWLFLLFICIILSVFGIVSNGGFIWVILRNPHLRSKTNYVLVSLAVSDLVVSAVVYPLSLGNYRRLFITYYSCVLAQSVLPCVPLVTISHLLVLTGDRFIAIIRPLRYSAVVTPKRLKIVVSLCWLIPLCLSSLPVMGWTVDRSHMFINGSARNSCDTFDVLTCPYVCMMVTPNIVSCVVILVLYGFIFQSARKHIQFANSFCQGTTAEIRQSRGVAQRELKSARLIFLTIGFFIISILPVCFSIYLDCYIVEIDLDVWFVLLFLTYFNSLLNPYIYGLGNTRIRKQVVISVCPAKCHQNDGQRSLSSNNQAISISTCIPSDATAPPSLGFARL